MRRWLRPRSGLLKLSLALSLAVLSGCAQLGYYARSVGGQMQILGRAQPIETLLEDPNTDPELKARLADVLEIRDFSCRELHLPDNPSYRRYADLERRYVVWNVFAAPELSTELETWCFPFAGCVSYRGYFSEDEAERFAADLQDKGLDACVTGVAAYSTLGWLDDPVLSTFINYSETSLARLMFHELAHQVVYVKDDSVFNESFATAVEMEGLRRWMQEAGSANSPPDLEETQRRKDQFVALVLKYRNRLDNLYASELTAEEKRQSKARVFLELREEYEEVRQGWGGYDGYDWWFARDLNNAHLASVAAYTELVPAFQELLARHEGDLVRFYQTVKALGKLPKGERDLRLRELAGPAEVARLKEQRQPR